MQLKRDSPHPETPTKLSSQVSQRCMFREAQTTDMFGQRSGKSAHGWTRAFALDHGASSKVVRLDFHSNQLLILSVAEWKVDRDSPDDTHRHLSHLIGLYPGYSITGYNSGSQGGLLVNGTRTTYTKAQVIDAATLSLTHRGDGTGPDADSGWEKAWRAAAWAQLGNAEKFYHILTVCLTIPDQAKMSL
jgi:hypothetical protein